MRNTLAIDTAEITPDAAAVRRSLGYDRHTTPDARIAALMEIALAQFAEHAAPAGIISEVGTDEFADIYRGLGKNEPLTPVAEIYPRANHLALMAVTVGAEVSTRISQLFEARDFALASILDAAASEGAERAADLVQAHWEELLSARLGGEHDMRLLRYSPGYCGWHISGQKALFAALRPQEIGISLSESFLMVPIKSVSAVIVAGPGEIHEFAMEYGFCAACQTKACRARIRQVMGGVGDNQSRGQSR
jgi:hypothetical protein